MAVSFGHCIESGDDLVLLLIGFGRGAWVCDDGRLSGHSYLFFIMILIRDHEEEIPGNCVEPLTCACIDLILALRPYSYYRFWSELKTLHIPHAYPSHIAALCCNPSAEFYLIYIYFLRHPVLFDYVFPTWGDMPTTYAILSSTGYEEVIWLRYYIDLYNFDLQCTVTTVCKRSFLCVAPG